MRRLRRTGFWLALLPSLVGSMARADQSTSSYAPPAQETRVALDMNALVFSNALPSGDVLLPVVLEGQWLVHRNVAIDLGLSGAGQVSSVSEPLETTPRTVGAWTPLAMRIGLHGVGLVRKSPLSPVALWGGFALSTSEPTAGLLPDAFWIEHVDLLSGGARVSAGVDGLAAGLLHYSGELAFAGYNGPLFRARASIDGTVGHGLSPGVMLFATTGTTGPGYFSDVGLEPFLFFSPAVMDSIFVRAGLFTGRCWSPTKSGWDATIVTQVGWRL
jgi:hypothetical protein